MTDSQIYDGQGGSYPGYAMPESYVSDDDVSRRFYVETCDSYSETLSPGDILSPPSTPFQPRFSQLVNPVVNPLVDPRFDRPSQVVVPAYDMVSAAPCLTGNCDMYESAFGPANISQSQLREEDIIRLILSANNGYLDQSRSNPAVWNNPEFAVYQPGRVPPSQVRGYDVARTLIDPNYVDERGMCPSSYQNCPSSMRPNARNPRMWVTPSEQNQSYRDQQWQGAQRNWQYRQWLQSQQRYPNQSWNPNQNWDPRQQWNPNLPYDPRQQWDGSRPYDPRHQWDPRQQYDPRLQYDPRQQWNPRQQYDPRQQWNQPYDGFNPGCNPGYDQQWRPDQGCNPGYNPYSRWNNPNPYNPGLGGNNTLTQMMRYAPFVLSMINRGNYNRGGFPGGYMNFNPGYGGYMPGGYNGYMNGGFGGNPLNMLLNSALNGGFGGGGGCNQSFNQFNRYNQFNQMNRYNNFNRGFNNYGGSRNSVRIGNFRIGF